MDLPLILVNFKLYESATGEQAVELAKLHERVFRETGASIGIAVNALDLESVCSAVTIPVFAQHMDGVKYGSCTGHILPELLKEKGAYGTLLNHAEYQMDNQALGNAIERAREVGLFTVVCANDVEKAVIIRGMDPDLIAVEPPELIGGDISVSKVGPEIIENAVKRLGENRVLVGAGIRDPEDVSIARQLGACGVLLASGVTKAEDPYTVLQGLVSGLKKRI